MIYRLWLWAYFDPMKANSHRNIPTPLSERRMWLQTELRNCTKSSFFSKIKTNTVKKLHQWIKIRYFSLSGLNWFWISLSINTYSQCEVLSLQTDLESVPYGSNLDALVELRRGAAAARTLGALLPPAGARLSLHPRFTFLPWTRLTAHWTTTQRTRFMSVGDLKFVSYSAD